MSQVPADEGVLWELHYNFVVFRVRWVIPHHLTDHECEDLVGEVFLRLRERKYLDKCRACEVRYALTGIPYSFLASLRKFVDRVAKNFLRYRHAQCRDPRRAGPIPEMRGWSDSDLDLPIRVPAALRVEARQDEQALASCLVDRMRKGLAAGRNIIGGVPAVEVFDRVLAEGIEAADKYEWRQLRRAVMRVWHVAG